MMLPAHSAPFVPRIASLAAAQTANEPCPEALFFVVVFGLPNGSGNPDEEKVGDK